jgi:Zn-dependent protease
MTFLIIWYLSGVIAPLAVDWFTEGEIKLKGLVLSLTLGGMCGFIMVILAIGAVISEYRDTQKWEDFWNQKIF